MVSLQASHRGPLRLVQRLSHGRWQASDNRAHHEGEGRAGEAGTYHKRRDFLRAGEVKALVAGCGCRSRAGWRGKGVPMDVLYCPLLYYVILLIYIEVREYTPAPNFTACSDFARDR